MSTETAPKGASIVSDGALALANDATSGTEASAKLRFGLPPPRPRLPTLEGVAPPPAIADFDDPTNPDEAEWELTSELRAKPLPSNPEAAPTLPSPGLRSLASDERATEPMASDKLDNLDDDDLDDSDLTSVYVRPESDDDDEEFNDEETSVAPMPSDIVPTAPKQLPPLLAAPMSRPVPPPPRSMRAVGLPAPGVPARPSVLPPPPIGGAARTSALPPGLLGMTTKPAAAPPPPPPPGRPSALLPPPQALSRAPLPPPGVRPPSVPPPPGGSRSAVPAPPITRARSVLPPAQLTRSSAPPPPPVGGGTLPPPPRSSAPPPALQTAPGASRGPGWMDHPQNSPFAVRPLTAPVARPSSPPPPPKGSSIAPVALSRESFPTIVKSPGLPRTRVVQLGALALLVAGLLGAVVVLLKQPSASAAAGAKGDGMVTVTVSGEDGAPIKDLTVVADDVVRCTSSPCKVTDLAAGTHFVRVTASGYTATAARAVAVTDDNRPTLHFQLTRIAEPVAATVREPEPAAPKAAEPAAAAPAVDLDADEAISTSAAARAPARPAARSREAAPSRAKSSVTETSTLKSKLAEVAEEPKSKNPVVEDDAAPAALSQLNISSNPSTLIVLDGRPLGKTPISGVKVSPGAHTIVFIGPEGKRKVGTATVKPGATRNIAVNF